MSNLRPSSPIRLWTQGACNPHGGHGGWAYVLVQEGVARGEAGGERGSTPRRMALIAALRALTALGPVAGPILVTTADAAILAGDEAEGEGDLRRQLAALAGPALRFAPAPATAEARTGAGFVQAWAAFAVDKVKAGGPFRAPIPRANLSKFPSLTAGS